ncbi:hypothetical protein [Streptomyces sp. NPDC001719]
MSGLVKLECARDGEVAEVIFISPSDAPPYELKVFRGDGSEASYPGDNLFACLLNLRRELEGQGLLLCCQGARRDVTNSGMQAQMTGGRFIYTFDAGSRKVNEETVDILAPARLDEVVTVEEQRVAIFDFLGIAARGQDG